MTTQSQVAQVAELLSKAGKSVLDASAYVHAAREVAEHPDREPTTAEEALALGGYTAMLRRYDQWLRDDRDHLEGPLLDQAAFASDG